MCVRMCIKRSAYVLVGVHAIFFFCYFFVIFFRAIECGSRKRKGEEDPTTLYLVQRKTSVIKSSYIILFLCVFFVVVVGKIVVSEEIIFFFLFIFIFHSLFFHFPLGFLSKATLLNKTNSNYSFFQTQLSPQHLHTTTPSTVPTPNETNSLTGHHHSFMKTPQKTPWEVKKRIFF